MDPRQTEQWVAAIVRADSADASVATLVERLVSDGCCRSAGVWCRASAARGWSAVVVRDPGGELIPPERWMPDPGDPPPGSVTADRRLIELPLESGSLLLQLTVWFAAGDLDGDALEALFLLAGVVDAAAGRLPELEPPPPLPGGVDARPRPAAPPAFLGRWLEPLDESIRRAVLARVLPPNASGTHDGAADGPHAEP